MISAHPMLAFIEGLGGPEMMMIMMIILVLFGKNKLPELARGMGKAVREFKKATSGVEEEFKRVLEEDEHKKIAPPPAFKTGEAAATPPAALPAAPASGASSGSDALTPTPAAPLTPRVAPPPARPRMLPPPDEEPPV